MTTLDISDAYTVVIHTEREIYDVTPLQEEDPNWSFTDAAGHVHRWKKSTRYNRETWRVPTVVQVVDDPGYDDPENDIYDPPITHYECKKCRAHVQPGYRTPYDAKKIAGLAHQTMDVTLPLRHRDVSLAAMGGDEVWLMYQGIRYRARLTNFQIVADFDARITATFTIIGKGRRPVKAPLST